MTLWLVAFIILFCQAVFLFGCAYVVKGIRERATKAIVESGNFAWSRSIYDFCMEALFLLLFLSYPMICTIVFSSFACNILDDGRRYLKTDPGVDCDSVQHAYVQGYAAVMVVIFPVMVPVTYYFVIWLYSRQLSRVQLVHEMIDRNERVADQATFNADTAGATRKSITSHLFSLP